MEFDYETYPDGISDPLDDFEPSVWDRGYYCETDEGVWYEVYLDEEQRKYYPDTKDLEESMEESNYDSLYLGDFQDYGQITFFVPNGEEEWTFEALTDMFI